MAKKKKRRDFRDDPGYLSQDKTYRQLGRQAKRETRLRYREPIRDVRQELGRSDERMDQIGGWFDAYKQDLQAKIPQSQALYGQTMQGMAPVNQAVAQTSQFQTPVSAETAQADQAAAGVRGALGQLFTDLLKTQGQAQDSYLAGRVGVAGAHQLTERLGENQYQQELRGDLRQLRGDRKDFRHQTLADLIREEQIARLERKAFDLDQYEAVTDAQNARKDRKQERRQKRREQKQYIAENDYNNDGKVTAADQIAKKKQEAKIEAKNETAEDETMTASAQKTAGSIRNSVVRVRRHDNGLPGYWDTQFNALVEKDGLDPIIARAIIQGARLGRLGPNTERALEEQYGITGLAFSRPPRKRPEPTTIDGPILAPGANGEMRPN